MKNVISISHYSQCHTATNHTVPGPEDSPASDAGTTVRAAHVLLQFPRPSPGPLPAAAIATIALLGVLASAVRI